VIAGAVNEVNSTVAITTVDVLGISSIQNVDGLWYSGVASVQVKVSAGAWVDLGGGRGNSDQSLAHYGWSSPDAYMELSIDVGALNAAIAGVGLVGTWNHSTSCAAAAAAAAQESGGDILNLLGDTRSIDVYTIGNRSLLTALQRAH